jgi:hypothetical protein
MSNKDFRAARPRIAVSVGESVRIVRELQEMTQSQLARLTGVPTFSHLLVFSLGGGPLSLKRARSISPSHPGRAETRPFPQRAPHK